jgi:DNA-binding response OmpR family regulator
MPQHASKNKQKNKQNVIILDDNKFVLRVLIKILQKAGHCVTPVETGHDLLERLKTKTYDAAIIAVRLQDVNGLDLLNKIQKINANMKKIVLTGYPSEEDRIRALEQGADYYLSKPIKSERLIEIVEEK